MLPWIEAHPVLFALLWPTVTALVTAVLKPRSVEEYAAMPPRLGAVLRLVGAIGFDVPKMLESVRQVLTGKRPGALSILAPMLLALALPLVGCTPGASSPARDTARATVLLIAEAEKAADAVCAVVAKDRADAKLAKACADAYDAGRASLLAAEGIVDAWDSADRGSYLCTLVHAVDALASVANAVKAAGGPTMPPVVVDALTLGGSLAKGCAS
jgi:hypothetical protein